MMMRMPKPRPFLVLVAAIACGGVAPGAADGGDAAPQQVPGSPRLTLRSLVDPAARIEVQGKHIRVGLHALIYFDTLADLFAHIDAEAGRWTFNAPAERAAFANGLMRRGVESRIVSMDTELPLEVLLTHTRDELERSVGGLRTDNATLVFKGQHWQLTKAAYRDALLGVRERWSTSLNCWSASSSIPGRVLSNWYLIDEGITLYGATYDSTEHFWQAVKYHPDVTVGDLRRSFATPAEFPAGTQKVKVLFDINRDAFWNLYVDLMRKPPARSR